MKTQKERILDCLKIWTSPLEAMKEAGTMKLATRVGELRKEGHDIEQKWGPDRAYMLYRLKQEEYVPKTVWQPRNIVTEMSKWEK